MSSISDAAAFLATEWRVFPVCLEREGDEWRKQPLVKWREEASRDPDTVRQMFAHPAANAIGVPMGADTGLFLLDLDTKRGAPGLEWLAENEHRLPATRTHRTPSGGLHLYFKWPHGLLIRNSAGKIAPGVDIRGEGGFAMVPPSPGYVITNEAMPADAPQWLLDLIIPPAPPKVAITYAAPAARIPDRYAEAALDGECRAVASQHEGGRNHRLNVAAVKLGSLVAAGALSEATVRAELRRAALHAGLDPRETDLTIQSGLTFGMIQPRAVPERQVQTIRIEIVPPEPPPYEAPPPHWEAEPEFDPAEGNPTQLKDTLAAPGLPLVYWQDIQPAISGADFVEGLLIEGAMTVVYGPSNCGKTFFCTDLAIHVATGRKWRGREIDSGGVIYCALEGAHGISNRVAAFRKRHGLEGVEVPFAIIPVTLDLLDPQADTGRLIDAIQAASAEMGRKVKLVVLDTLSRAMSGGNENSPEDMGALVSNGDRIRQVTGSHVIWVHHSGKDQAQGARGHSLLRAATDTEIEISRPDKESPSTAKVTKQRELQIDGAWTFTLERVQLGTDRRGKPVTSCVVVDADGAVTMGGPKLSQGAQAGLTSLHEALIQHGKRGVGRDIPEGVRVVTLEAWRREFYARSHLDTQDAKRQAFHRAIKDLRAIGKVRVLNDFAWERGDD